MEIFYSRAAKPEDFEALVLLVQAHLQADYQGENTFSAGDLQRMWEACQPETDTLVLTDASESLVAFAWFPSRVRRENMFIVDPLFFVLPSARGKVEAQLIESVETRRLPPDLPRKVVQPMITNTVIEQALIKAGYTFELAFQKMVIAFEEEPLVEQISAGLEIRPFVVGKDEQQAYAADEEASLDKGYSRPVPYEAWASRMLNDPELCFLAWDGVQVAGGVYTQVYEGQGLVHHLGVRRPWRQRGVGASLMHITFAACYRVGLRKVWLEVDTRSPTRANHLYEKIGMRIVGARSYYQKALQ